jgi:site-specific DNA recombinase
VLNGLRTHLMEPNLFKKFCEEFTREVNRARIERSASIVGHREELEKVERDLDRAIQAIPDGVPGAQVKDRIGAP